MQLEPDLGTSSNLTEAGYTAILVVAAAFLLIVFVGVRICLYKYSEANGDGRKESFGSDDTLPMDSPPRSKSSTKSVLSGISGIDKTKSVWKGRKKTVESWTLWTLQMERDGVSTVAETLDDATTTGGRSIRGTLSKTTTAMGKSAKAHPRSDVFSSFNNKN